MTRQKKEKTEGKTWERFGRRFVLRLSLKREIEKSLLDEYDRRSAILGKEDKPFLRDCLIAGYQILINKGIDSVSIALSNNESNNTDQEQIITAAVEATSKVKSVKKVEQPNVRAISTTQDQPKQAAPKVEEAAGREPAKNFLGGLMKHQ